MKQQTIKELLDQIIHDPNLNPEDFVIYYEDRHNKELEKVKFNDITKIIDGFMIIPCEDKTIHIPLHRVRKVFNKKEMIWSRKI